MGNRSSLPKFNTIPETEVLKFYFTPKQHSGEVYNIDIRIPNGENFKDITTVIYYIQFISMNRVVDEISINCQYSNNSNFFKIKLDKHVTTNKSSIKQINEMYEYIRIGFPVRPYISRENTILSFTRVGLNTFLISLRQPGDDENTTDIGILNFKNVNKDSSVEIEQVVKCVVRTKINTDHKDLCSLGFVMHSPCINDNSIQMHLTQQYRISTSYDTTINKIYIYDVGIQRIIFKNNIATLYSMTSNPKTKMVVKYLPYTDGVAYIFKNYSVVY